MVRHDIRVHPFKGGQVITDVLTEGPIAAKQAARFLQAVQALPGPANGAIVPLNVAMPAGTLAQAKPGLF